MAHLHRLWNTYRTHSHVTKNGADWHSRVGKQIGTTVHQELWKCLYPLTRYCHPWKSTLRTTKCIPMVTSCSRFSRKAPTSYNWILFSKRTSLSVELHLGTMKVINITEKQRKLVWPWVKHVQRHGSGFCLGWSVEDKTLRSMNVNFCHMEPGSIPCALGSCCQGPGPTLVPCSGGTERKQGISPGRHRPTAAPRHAPASLTPSPKDCRCARDRRTSTLSAEASFLKASSPSCRRIGTSPKVERGKRRELAEAISAPLPSQISCTQLGAQPGAGTMPVSSRPSGCNLSKAWIFYTSSCGWDHMQNGAWSPLNSKFTWSN